MTVTFRFDTDAHEYIATNGAVLPHITSMLKETGWVDDRWFTDASRDRGYHVHRLCADYDIGALEDPTLAHAAYKNYLLAHVQAVQTIRPTWIDIEVARVHPVHRFGGRPDRTASLYGLYSVLEIKSGPPEKGHLVQTALQAILVAPDLGLPPEAIQRFCLHLKPNGKWMLDQHKDPRDFVEARRVIRRCCR